MPSYTKQIEDSPYSLHVSTKFQDTDGKPNLRVTFSHYKNGVRTQDEPEALKTLTQNVVKSLTDAGFEAFLNESVIIERGYSSQGFGLQRVQVKPKVLIDLADKILRFNPKLAFMESIAEGVRKQEQPAESIEVRLRESLTRAMPDVASETINAAVAALVKDIPELTPVRATHR